MTQDKDNKAHWIADEGTVFKRISDGFIFGNEIYLGYTYYLNGEKLTEPKLEVIEDFEEIEDIYNKDKKIENI